MNILIVKLGALGDVLRTTPLLTALKRRYPQSRITWLVDPSHEEILRGNPLIDCLVTSREALSGHSFDWAINLDKEEEALEAISAASAREKRGFGRDAQGKLCALDPASDYAYRLGIDDELKFRKNKKTYQEISFEQAGLHFHKEEYLMPTPEEAARGAKRVLKDLGVDTQFHDRLTIGLNTGSGTRFAGKKLYPDTYRELAERFSKELDATVLLLGGKAEEKMNAEMEALCKGRAIAAGAHPIHTFAGIVRECDLVISGDTTAMHVAIAMKVPLVVFFGSTSAAEIELYGRGRKIVSDLPCAPCYLSRCPIDELCMREISAQKILETSGELLGTAKIHKP